jgi:hypothetical protein
LIEHSLVGGVAKLFFNPSASGAFVIDENDQAVDQPQRGRMHSAGLAQFWPEQPPGDPGANAGKQSVGWFWLKFPCAAQQRQLFSQCGITKGDIREQRKIGQRRNGLGKRLFDGLIKRFLLSGRNGEQARWLVWHAFLANQNDLQGWMA